MKKTIFLATALLTQLAFASQSIPHFDLEMTTQEYQNYLKLNAFSKGDMQDGPDIAYAIKLGERLSKWIAKINSTRSESEAIRLTSPQTRRSIPIDRPNIYSPETIKKETQDILTKLPTQMKSVLLGLDELPTNLEIDDQTFILNARLVDRNYQSAARYKSLNPFRSEYILMAKKDVRGFYFLTKNKINADFLKDVNSIPSDQVDSIKKSLLQICENNAPMGCKSKLNNAWSENKLSDFYNTYYPKSKKLWDSFFKIPVNGRRHDISWIKNMMTVPFNTPEIEKFVPYLRDNIQDEFKFSDWKLILSFGTYEDGPRLKFEGGVVPHVNKLGGNEIVMDANQPIEEYESQWTIRHEFGHVLGLPDCYHEFYDINQKAFVNYQLDVTDLMCSRAGNMTERIYQELKGAYTNKK